jgi:hypothetical protein
VDAVDQYPLTIAPTNTALGTDADTWFMALDGRGVRVGGEVGVLCVEGIHCCGSRLWIQVALFDPSTPGVVLEVDAGHSQHDVLETLKDYKSTGVPLEIIKVTSCRRTI